MQLLWWHAAPCNVLKLPSRTTTAGEVPMTRGRCRHDCKKKKKKKQNFLLEPAAPTIGDARALAVRARPTPSMFLAAVAGRVPTWATGPRFRAHHELAFSKHIADCNRKKAMDPGNHSEEWSVESQRAWGRMHCPKTPLWRSTMLQPRRRAHAMPWLGTPYIYIYIYIYIYMCAYVIHTHNMLCVCCTYTCA